MGWGGQRKLVRTCLYTSPDEYQKTLLASCPAAISWQSPISSAEVSHKHLEIKLLV